MTHTGSVGQTVAVGAGGNGAPPSISVWKLGMQGVASMLGVSSQNLQQTLASGKSLAQVLHTGGKTLEDGAQAFLSGVQSGLSDAVTAGTITQQQADRFVQGQTQRMQNMLHDGGSPDSGGAATLPAGTSSTGLVIDASV